MTAKCLINYLKQSAQLLLKTREKTEVMKKTGIIILLFVLFNNADISANSINNRINNLQQMTVNKNVPADPRPKTIKQPNGKTLTFYIRGDERISWAETLDGYTLLYGESGTLEYACIDDGLNLIASGIIACNEDERDEYDNAFLQDLPKKLFFSQQQTEFSLKRFNPQSE